MTPGADEKGRFLPITTSYDYDAPISEAGDPTPKLFALRDVISKVPYHLTKRQRLLLILGKGVPKLFVKGSHKSVVVVGATELSKHPMEAFLTLPNGSTWGDTHKLYTKLLDLQHPLKLLPGTQVKNPELGSWNRGCSFVFLWLLREFGLSSRKFPWDLYLPPAPR